MSDDSFLEYVLEQLEALPGVHARRMFGGHGLYWGESFFAIVHDGTLYFRTDETTRDAYQRRNMRPFAPKPGQVLKRYHEVPPDVLDDADELVRWARDAAARRG